MSKMSQYYVHWNGAAWFVKEAEFFIAQGGLTSEWGKAWHPIYAMSIEEARRKARTLFADIEKGEDRE